MTGEMVEFLDKLATQLGTTSQYLWAVLIRQAPIDGVVSLAQYAVIAWASWVWVRWFRKKRDYIPESTGMALIVTGVVLAITIIVAFFSVPDTVSSFVNPEYWALRKVLGAVSD